MAAGLSNMLKSGEKSKFKGKKFVLKKKTKEVFEKLKRLFTTAPILVHYNLAWRIMVESDTFSFTILTVISQLLEVTGQWHSVAFWLQKMQPVKRNYRVGKSEMLAIVEACKHWQHYLEDATYKVRMITNHCNLRMFLTIKNLTRAKQIGESDSPD